MSILPLIIGAPCVWHHGLLACMSVLQVLHAAATLAHEFIMDEARVAPRALLDTAVQLHHVMLSLQGLQGLAVQAVISKVRGAGRPSL